MNPSNELPTNNPSEQEPGAPVVAKVATTPDHAKVLAALLQAEGIPAHVDGQSLADEFAMTQRLMNTQGVRVLVPAGSLDMAQEILADSSIDDAELEAQALAAAPEASDNDEPDQQRRFAWLFWPPMIFVYLFLPGLLYWLLSGLLQPGSDG